MGETDNTENMKSFRLSGSKPKKKDDKTRYKLKKVESDAHGVRIAVWDSKHPAFIIVGIVVTAGAAFGAGALAGLLARLLGREEDFGLGWGLSAAVGGLGAYLTSGHYVVLDFNDMWTSLRRVRFNLGFSRRFLTRRVKCIRYDPKCLAQKENQNPNALERDKAAALVLEIDSGAHLVMKGIDKQTAEGILEAIWQRYPGFRPAESSQTPG